MGNDVEHKRHEDRLVLAAAALTGFCQNGILPEDFDEGPEERWCSMSHCVAKACVVLADSVINELNKKDSLNKVLNDINGVL